MAKDSLLERMESDWLDLSRSSFDRVEAGIAANTCQEAMDEIGKLRNQLVQAREALKFARKRIEYYGTISHRRHFDHDLAEVYPRIDAALTDDQGAT